MIGRYVSFEGVEGAGKSTIAGLLAAHLETVGVRVVRVREPGGTATGERIRDILLEPGGVVAAWSEALLFAASRAQLAHEVVAPALAAGKWVVTDRSVYSSLAYQGAARGLGVEAVRAVNTPGLGGVWPDLVVLLRLDADTGLARQEVPDRIGGEDVEFQRAVAAAFDELAAAEPERFVVIDAARPVDEVWEEVLGQMEARWVISSKA